MVDTKPMADPGEHVIGGRTERQNREHIAEDLAHHNESENGALGECMQYIHRGVLGILLPRIDGNPTSCHKLVHFVNPKLADRNGSRNTRHGGCDKVLSRNT